MRSHLFKPRFWMVLGGSYNDVQRFGAFLSQGIWIDSGVLKGSFAASFAWLVVWWRISLKRVYPFSLIDGGGFRAVQMMLQEVDVFFVSDRSRKWSCETSKKGHTLPKTNMDPQKWWFPIWISFSSSLFSGTMLIFRGCTFMHQKLMKLANNKFTMLGHLQRHIAAAWTRWGWSRRWSLFLLSISICHWHWSSCWITQPMANL